MSGQAGPSLAEELSYLSAEEISILRRCLKAAAEGPFFPDWEFPILFGVDRLTVQEIARDWSIQTVDEGDLRCAVFNSIAHLFMGYPHGCDADLQAYVPEGTERVMEILRRIRKVK